MWFGHAACACGHCGLPLDPKWATGIEKRQVFDLPERPLLVTEHQASIYRCAHCRGVTKAAFPEGVVSPAQYGERIDPKEAVAASLPNLAARSSGTASRATKPFSQLIFSAFRRYSNRPTLKTPRSADCPSSRGPQ
jgi:hypothetical protein